MSNLVLECFFCADQFAVANGEEFVRCPSCARAVRASAARILGRTSETSAVPHSVAIRDGELTTEQIDEIRWIPSYYEMHRSANKESDMQIDFDANRAAKKVEAVPKRQRSSADCLPLLESAHLNIYRENLFRITGLPIDATQKQAKRRVDELKMLQEAGQLHGVHSAAFALDPAPSLDQIRDAVQRLDEPEHRLIDEFFWFWPESFGNSASDPALLAISKGDSSSAYEIWLAAEKHPEHGYVATHNIAIMFHLIALDWTQYHIASEIDSEREGKIRGYWDEGVKKWEITASDERLWDALKLRIRSLNDARLTTGFARRMCDTLPEALDKINAEAAIKFAEQGRMKWAQTHVELMRKSHQGLDDVAKTAELVLSPTRTRIGQLIASAKETVKEDATKGAVAAKQLVEESLRLRNLYDLFHEKDAHQKTELFDEVAIASIECLVMFQKKTGKNEEFVSILRSTLPLATAIDIRRRIQENIAIGENNMRNSPLGPLYERLKDIQESEEPAEQRLSRCKFAMKIELASLAEAHGASSMLVQDLSNALAVVLRGISLGAHNDEEDFDTALEAIRLAVRLAKSADLKKQTQEDLTTLEKNFSKYQQGLVNLEIRSDKIVIDRESFRYNSQVIKVRDITGVRFGIFAQYRNGAQSSVSYLIGLMGGGKQISIECKRFWRSEDQARADYRVILEGIYQNILPKLAVRIAKSIAAGNSLDLGGTKITKDGIYLRTGMLMWEKEHLIPWKDVRYGNHNGSLNISSSANDKLAATMSVRDVWNAVIFEPILKTLVDLKSSDQ